MHPSVSSVSTDPGQRSAIVLAGGEGTRLRPFIREFLGSDRPKQFCSFWNDETLLEYTLRRVSAIVPPENVSIVIGKGQAKYLKDLDLSAFSGRVLEQRVSRGTGGAVFLALAHAASVNPGATVLIVPTDHFVIPEDRFIRHLERLFTLTERHPHRILLLGAKPDRAETEFGYIQPGRPLRNSMDFSNAVRDIEEFREKPSAVEAERLVQDGALWSTMVTAAKLGSLWSIGKQALPEPMESFARLYRHLSTHSPLRPRQCETERQLLQSIPPFDFSRDLISHSIGRSAVLPLEDVYWSDLGREDWLTEAVELQKRFERPVGGLLSA